MCAFVGLAVADQGGLCMTAPVASPRFLSLASYKQERTSSGDMRTHVQLQDVLRTCVGRGTSHCGRKAGSIPRPSHAPSEFAPISFKPSRRDCERNAYPIGTNGAQRTIGDSSDVQLLKALTEHKCPKRPLRRLSRDKADSERPRKCPGSAPNVWGLRYAIRSSFSQILSPRGC